MTEESRRGAGRLPGAVPETFVFVCGGCGFVWQAVFQVVFFTDPTSLYSQEYVDEAGRAVRSPVDEAVCPRCRGRTVRVTTPGLAGAGRASSAAAHTGKDRPSLGWLSARRRRSRRKPPR
ncbi:hypothetical protein ACFYOV_17355 [Streptomyces sp. NPDC005931]|uniref:hypothetical protein n=1 Tax=Streptomyces sp. NPDC005931 TaxID=3364737 RepID=UPI00369E1FB4